MSRIIVKYNFNIKKFILISENKLLSNKELISNLIKNNITVADFYHSISLEVKKTDIVIKSVYYDFPLASMYFYVTLTQDLTINNENVTEIYPKLFYKKELVHVNRIETNPLFQKLGLGQILFDELFQLFNNNYNTKSHHYILRCNPFGNTDKTTIYHFYLKQGFKSYPKIFTGKNTDLMFKK
jgi:hypothetical protein